MNKRQRKKVSRKTGYRLRTHSKKLRCYTYEETMAEPVNHGLEPWADAVAYGKGPR